MARRIPTCAHAIVGGSATAAIDFPAALDDPRVSILDDSIVVRTPVGDTPPLRRIAVTRADGSTREALVARLHGWRHDRARRDATLALFWGFRDAGVRRVVAEGRAADGHVFNLGHGVLPETDPDTLARVADLVHSLGSER